MIIYHSLDKFNKSHITVFGLDEAHDNFKGQKVSRQLLPLKCIKIAGKVFLSRRIDVIDWFFFYRKTERIWFLILLFPLQIS